MVNVSSGGKCICKFIPPRSNCISLNTLGVPTECVEAYLHLEIYFFNIVRLWLYSYAFYSPRSTTFQGVGLGFEEFCQFFYVVDVGVFFGHNGFTNNYAQCFTLFVEYLGRQSQRTEYICDAAQEVECKAVATVVIYGYNGLFELLDQTYNVGLPIAVAGREIGLQIGYCTCREKSDGMTVANVAHCRPDTVH